MTYTITFTFPVPSVFPEEMYVQSVIEAIDDATGGEANILECKVLEEEA